MRLPKHILIFALLLILSCTIGTGMSLACEENEKSENNTKTSNNCFKDVGPEHWAYEAISQMAQRKIIGGYPDGTFKPEKPVTRDEFSKMMVLALNLPENKPQNPTFKDIPKNYWAYVPIESAKAYLTGFRTSNGDYFKPQNSAVREDMAVALVKALGYGGENVDDSVLDVFIDSNQISSNLKKYVKIAVKHNLMQGYPITDSSKKSFKPQNSLSRAEASALLLKVLKEEKVTYEEETEEKVTYDDITETPEENETVPAPVYIVPQVTAQTDSSKIVLKWEQINSPLFQGYKIVISKNNPTPKYPEDGYLYYITDKNRTYAYIDNTEPYKNGDFGKYLVSGEKYYFSVTALYKDKKIPGNVIYLEMP